MNNGPEFYVGYLPVPPRLKRWITGVIAICVAIVMCSAVAIAMLQRNPGNGKWDLDHLSEFTGVIRFAPYPVLVTDEPDSKTLILVVDGKFGADSKTSNLANKKATLNGHVIQRGSLLLLELDIENPIKQSGETIPEALVAKKLDSRVLIGEIIDPKCYAGAMKPGEGKTHKACAVLCLRGGIPPVFLDQNGRLLIVTDRDGKALVEETLEQIMPYVGDLVSARGEAFQIGDQLQFRIDPQSIRRL